MKLSKLTPIVLAMVLAGCAVGPDYQPPEMTLDTEYLYQNVQGMSSGQLEEKTTWWMQFNDLTLNALVAEAQQQNIPLKMAAERIKAAQAYQQAIESFKVPTHLQYMQFFRIEFFFSYAYKIHKKCELAV